MPTRLLLFAMLMTAASAIADVPVPRIQTMRVPDGGIQPQVAVDGRGVVHLVYFKGHEHRGDLYYVRSADGGDTWSKPLRVNSQAQSAIAIGTMRCAQMALGRDVCVHVAWMGSDVAQPRAGGKGTPMLFARLRADGAAFEPQRNIIHEKVGLDGGGSVAADEEGNVYVAWHAPVKRDGDEQDRRVWIARSTDDGRTFVPEYMASNDVIGACGCCGMKIAASGGGGVRVLFRNAATATDRDLYLLASSDRGKTFSARKLSSWNTARCPASTAAFAADGTIAAWESQDKVLWSRLDGGGRTTHPVSPATSGAQRHPSISTNSRGQVLLTWAEGTGWGKGGSVAWQCFDTSGQPITGGAGRRDGLPVWSLPAVFMRADGRFVVLY